MRSIFIFVCLISATLMTRAQTDFPFVANTQGKIQVGLFNQGITGLINPIRSPEGQRLFSTSNGLQAGYFVQDRWMVQGAITHSIFQFQDVLESVGAELGIRYIYPVWRLHLFGQATIEGNTIVRNTISPDLSGRIPDRNMAAALRFGLTFHINPRWALESSYGGAISFYNNLDGFLVRVNPSSAPVRLGVNFRF